MGFGLPTRVSQLAADGVGWGDPRKQHNPRNGTHFIYKTYLHFLFLGLHTSLFTLWGQSPSPQLGLVNMFLLCSDLIRSACLYCPPLEMETTFPALLTFHSLPRLLVVDFNRENKQITRRKGAGLHGWLCFSANFKTVMEFLL